MVSGCVSGSAYKIGGGFDFVCQQISWAVSGGSAWCITAYCAELGAYYGTYSYQGKRANYVAAGGVVTLRDSTGANVGTSQNWDANGITITPCDFVEISTAVSGKGGVTITGTRYASRYYRSGVAVTIVPSPSTGFAVKKVLLNGSELASPYSFTPDNDASVVVYFAPSSYTISFATPSGGTLSFTKNGNAVTPTNNSFTADEGDIIVCTATPNSDKMVQNFALDGAITSGGSTTAQSFSFTVYEKTDSAAYNVAVTFCDRTAVTDTVIGKSGGTVDDAVVTCDGATVTRSATGAFAAFTGNTYTATAATPTAFRTFNGWLNANGETVSESASYTWTQGSASVGITADYEDKPLYTENFYVGTSTSDYGTGGTAYVAGCRADITRPTGTESSGKWLGGTRTVTATTTPGVWTFSGVYVSDTDKSGGTKFYNANGASSVTFESACNANVYAIFANGEEVALEDVDEGNSSIASGSAATGLYIWEGASTKMTATWKSKMYVSSKPLALSAARVYADGYAVSVKAHSFQSPDSADSKAVTVSAKSQDAFRLPMRRPEKYIEIELSTTHEVSQAAVATSMEALWQT